MINRPQTYIEFSQNSSAYGIMIRMLDENFDPVIDPPLGEAEEGEPIVFMSDSIMENSLTITESMCEPGALRLGGVVAASFECTLLMPYSWVDMLTADATYAEVWFTVPGLEDYYEYYGIRKGQYRFTIERTGARTTKLKGYDDLASDYYNTPLTQFDGQVLGTDNTTVAEALALLGIQVSGWVASSSEIIGTMDFTKNGGFYRATRRDILSWICEIEKAYACGVLDGIVDTRLWLSVIKPVDMVIDKTVEEPWYDVSVSAFTGVVYETTSGEIIKKGSDGNLVVVKNNPFIRGTGYNIHYCNAWAEALYTYIQNKEVIPFSLNWMGDPALQAGDRIEFEVATATGTRTINTWVSQVTYVHNGTCTLSLDKGEEYTDDNSVIGSPSSSSNQYGWNSGDIYTSNTVILGQGFTTASGTSFWFMFPFSRPINASGFTINNIRIGARIPSGGYLFHKDSSNHLTQLTNANAMTYDAISTDVLEGMGIRIIATCNNGWSDYQGNVQNNIPVSISARLTITFI